MAGHLNHGLRPEAEKESELCAAFCEELGVPFAGGKADARAIAQTFRLSIAEAARRARYEFLQQAAHQLDCAVIVTGHTADDHAETILLNLSRGTGLRGAAGIAQQRDNIVRPILAATRAETRAFCTERGLWFHDDPTNFLEDAPRIRIRQQVMPALTAINPRAMEALARFAELAREEDAFLDQAAGSLLQQAERPSEHPLAFLTRDLEIRLDRAFLVAAPAVLRRRALRLLARYLGTELDHEHAESLAAQLVSGEEEAIDLPGGEVRLRLQAEDVLAERIQEEEPFRYPVTLPGETFADAMGWVLTATVTPPDDYQRPARSLDVKIDAKATKGGLHFRSAQTGERMQPLGMDGTKLISDMLRESGLSRHARRRLPLVCDLVGPVWIPGIAIASRVAITPTSREAIHLKFGAIGPEQP